MIFYIRKIFIILLFLFFFVFLSAELVEVVKLNPNIRLDIRYATKKNFTGKKVYSSAKCYLQREAALALIKVQNELEKEDLGLKVYDGYRPLSVQKIFWELFPNPHYVANPEKGSIHNRGIAIDLTLVNLKTGKELKMPSEFDDFSEKAHRNYGAMKPDIKKNCKKLEDVMVKYGFIPYQNEWWHFNWKNWHKFTVLDISFEELEKQAKLN